jgi:hypothetical protein
MVCLAASDDAPISGDVRVTGREIAEIALDLSSPGALC